MTIAKHVAEETGSAAQRDRRKRILDTTYALAAEGGFDAVQMRAVADQADVALGTLYRYFPSKIHLLVSALQRQFDNAVEVLNAQAIPGDTPADRVINVLKRLSRGMQGDPKLTEALTRAFMFADSSVAAEVHAVG
jgi:TetR/AcrR family transcriptional regulator, cholesterol catabolism regulator